MRRVVEEEDARRQRRRQCELCLSATAAAYCEADGARLCWRCDAAVHGANFLVARHNRFLLCAACGRAMPWHAAGPRLAPTKSLCYSCVGIEKTDLGEDDAETFDENGDLDEEEIEEQVSPLTAAPTSPAASSSNGDKEIVSHNKRMKRRWDSTEDEDPTADIPVGVQDEPSHFG